MTKEELITMLVVCASMASAASYLMALRSAAVSVTVTLMPSVIGEYVPPVSSREVELLPWDEWIAMLSTSNVVRSTTSLKVIVMVPGCAVNSNELRTGAVVSPV